jgi:IS5 family transposase
VAQFSVGVNSLVYTDQELTAFGVELGRSGQKRGMTRSMKAMIKRRSAIEPTIGHMKSDGRLARNPLKGALGDALHAVLSGAGHNIRLLLSLLRLFAASLTSMLRWILGNQPSMQASSAV